MGPEVVCLRWLLLFVVGLVVAAVLFHNEITLALKSGVAGDGFGILQSIGRLGDAVSKSMQRGLDGLF